MFTDNDNSGNIHDEMNITNSLLPRQWETKCRQKKAPVLTQFKNCLWTCNRMRQPETAASMAINFTTIAAIVTPLQDQPFWFYRKLKRSQAKKYPDSKENRLHDEIKSFRIQHSQLNSRFKISGVMYGQTGEFLFRIRPLVWTNPILKRSGFLKNPEQFPLE